MHRDLDCFEHCLELLPPVLACEESLSAVAGTIGLAGLEDEEEWGGLACPVSRGTALCVVPHGRRVGVVGAAGISQEEAVACRGGAGGQCQGGMGDTSQVRTSVVWESCRVACSGPCMADPVACSEERASAFLEGVVMGDQAEMGEVQSGDCGLGCGRTMAQEDWRSRIGWRHRDRVQGGS
jgi:hypothetical protein